MIDDVKVVKFTDRLRHAWKAFKGNQVGTLQFGVKVQRCDKCDKTNPPDILYLCDGRQCDNCSSWCKHTQDINHAVNFQKFEGDRGPYFVEHERILTEENV